LWYNNEVNNKYYKNADPIVLPYIFQLSF
jgi:hypothetical protein